MAAPTFIQEAEVGWAQAAGATRVTPSFSVQVGDILCACLLSEDFDGTGGLSASDSGSNSWTQQQEISVSTYTDVDISTAIAASAASLTGTVTRVDAGNAKGFGANFLTFRGSDGVGASNKTNASGAPSLSLTTTQANSAIVVVVGDWNASDGTTRTWRTVNSITPSAGNGFEVTYYSDGSLYGLYIAYYPDVGAAGSKTVGLTVPSGQKYSIAAVEIKGAAGGGSPKLFRHGNLSGLGSGGPLFQNPLQ